MIVDGKTNKEDYSTILEENLLEAARHPACVVPLHTARAISARVS